MEHLQCKKRKLSVYIPEYLPCMVCKERVNDYKMCKFDFIYCSYNCFSVLYLAFLNNNLITYSSFIN